VGFGAHASLRDLWAGKEVAAHDGVYSVELPAHGAALLKVER
jgi:hypothetical protein